MPIDQYDDDDENDKEAAASGPQRKFKEFDCPSCNANNPCGDPIGDGDEIVCNYCGTEYEVKVSEEGKLKLREL